MNDIRLTRELLGVCEGRVSPDDVTIREIQLPAHVHGFVLVDPEEHYNIYLREADPRWQQYRTLEHELRHIVTGDIYSNLPIEELEGL